MRGQYQIKAHLILSSGGVKCISYAGAISELEKNGVEIVSVSACSAGSIVGALFCSGLSSDQLVNQIFKLNFTDFYGAKKILSRFWYPFAKYEKSMVPEVFCDLLLGRNPTFDELTMPFATIGVDIISKQFLVYSDKTVPKMLVSEALKISTAVPFMTSPHNSEGRIVVDAAIATETPVWIAPAYEDDFPIIVLQPAKMLRTKISKSVGHYINSLISAGVKSRDQQLINQIPRISVIDIDCGEIDSLELELAHEQKEILVNSGRDAVKKAIQIYGNDFSFNSVRSNTSQTSQTLDGSAATGAEKMIQRFTNKLPDLLRDQVFISYSHKDREWLERFQVALKPFIRNQAFKVWADELIQVGTEWRKEIDQALESTKVAVLLVTQNFLASDFINDVELNHFIEESKRKNVTICWIAITKTNYEETPLKIIQCANDPNKPLKSLNDYEQDEAIVEICRKVKIAFTH